MNKELLKKLLGEEDIDEKVIETLSGWLFGVWDLRKHIYFKRGNMPLEIKMMNYKELIKWIENHLKNHPEQESLLHKIVEQFYAALLGLEEVSVPEDSIEMKMFKLIYPKNFEDIINYIPIEDSYCER